MDTLRPTFLAVQKKIAFFNDNLSSWRMASEDFFAWGEGEHTLAWTCSRDIRSTYYPGWAPADFQAVYDAMEEA